MARSNWPKQGPRQYDYYPSLFNDFVNLPLLALLTEECPDRPPPEVMETLAANPAAVLRLLRAQ